MKILVQLVVVVNSSISSPAGAAVSQALPEETAHPCECASAGDVLFLICGSKLSRSAKNLIRNADEKQMPLIVLDAGGDLPPSRSAKTLSIRADDPTLIRMLRYAVMHAICQAVDHVSEESIE